MIITDSHKSVNVAIRYDSQPENDKDFMVDVKPIPDDQVVDSNGAGDSFVGGFLAKICHIES